MTAQDADIRTFIAIELSDEVKEFLRSLSSRLKRTAADVKWTRIEGIHLTLKFLGNISPDLLPALENEVGLAFSGQKPLKMHVNGVGAFPSLAKARVIWAGLEDSAGELAPLARRVEDLLMPLGFTREKRPFAPHLTLGRTRSNKGLADLVEEVRQNMDVSGPYFVADQAVLFQSILKPTGAEYHPLVRFPFSEE